MADVRVNMTSFSPPPVGLALEHALDFHLEQNPSHIAITYPLADGKSSKSYSYGDLVPAVHRAGHAILENFSASSRRTSPVVVILVRSDSVTYLTVVAGLLRAGLTPFPISPRFSASVVAHLINESRPAAIIVDDSTRDFVKKALGDTKLKPILCPLPSFLVLFPGHNQYTPLPKHERRPEDICVLLHSSGSTANFPKLIPWTSFTVTHHGEVKDEPLQQLAGKVLGCFGLELFHGYGLSFVFTMIRRGLVLAVMNPADSASILPTEAMDIYRSWQLCKPKIIVTNPRAIEAWAADPEKVSQLRDADVFIYFSGRFLNKNVGDKLVKNGVKLCSVYGGTELGPIAVLPPFQMDDWEYFAVYPRPDINFVSRSDNDPVYELFVSPTEEPSYLTYTNATWEGRPAYNPGDLFLAHPSKPHTYKMFGRLDDRIMLATGQAINPIPIEEELTRHPLIKSAVMFGHTRLKVGLIVGGPDSVYERNEYYSYLENIWSVVESINMMSPAHIRVAHEMIIPASHLKPISIGPKGYPRRAIVWLQYQDEIDALYSTAR